MHPVEMRTVFHATLILVQVLHQDTAMNQAVKDFNEGHLADTKVKHNLTCQLWRSK